MKFKVTGIQDTVKRLQTFQRKLRTKILRQAGNEGSKVILPAMKSNTPTAKKDYGKGGSLKRSMGRKVQVKADRMWFGVGPRTKWQASVAKKFRFYRDKQGRIRKAPAKAGFTRNERPSRRAHLSEKQTGFISRTLTQTRAQADERMRQVLEDEVAKV